MAVWKGEFKESIPKCSLRSKTPRVLLEGLRVLKHHPFEVEQTRLNVVEFAKWKTRFGQIAFQLWCVLHLTSAFFLKFVQVSIKGKDMKSQRSLELVLNHHHHNLLIFYNPCHNFGH